MAERARRIGVENLSERLPVANPRDELGRLAATFNELLGRLEASLTQQRQFMADASHELRTPVATARTAASVALQQPHRDERDYRETLEIIEQQTVRLSRIVDDMFTLARADAGNYPVHRDADVPRRSRGRGGARRPRAGIAQGRRRSSRSRSRPPSFTGDEDLIRRLIVNLLDNAIRHAPPGSTSAPSSSATPDGYAISISDQGPGIPAGHPAAHLRAVLSGRRGARAASVGRRRRPGPGAGALDRQRPRRRRHAGAVVRGRHDLHRLAAHAALRADTASRLSPIHPRVGTLVSARPRFKGVSMSDNSVSMIPIAGLLATMAIRRLHGGSAQRARRGGR